MSKQTSPLIISNPQKGIAPSAYFGFEEIRNINITDKPGICYPHLALVKESSTYVDDLIEGFTKTSESEVWGYSKEVGNKVFKRTSAGVWSELTAHTDTGIGVIQFWKGYVAIIQIGGSIDWYNITDDSCDTSWASDAISDAPGSYMAVIHSVQDDCLYIGGGRVIDMIEENSGQNFVPATGATYAVTKAKLTLPEGYNIISMVEVGDKIYIGTSKDGNDAEGIIFIWDPTQITWEGVLTLKDESILNMISVNNFLYIQGGRKGSWYVSNGVSIQKIAQIPYTLINLSSKNLRVNLTRNSICYMNGLIYFGVSAYSGNTPLEGLGVWSLNPNTYALNFEYTISAGEYGQSSNKSVYIGALMPIGGDTTNLNVSWFEEKGGTYGVDDIGSARYTSDLAFIISQFSRVGTFLQERNFNSFEIYLSSPMVSGDSIKLYYRTAQNGNWLNIINKAVEDAADDTEVFMSYTKDGAIQTFGIDKLIEVENIQFKIVLNGSTEFLELRAV